MQLQASLISLSRSLCLSPFIITSIRVPFPTAAFLSPPQDVICTSRDGDRFWKLAECYIRGNSIKYLRIPEEIIDQVPEEEVKPQRYQGGGGGAPKATDIPARGS